MSEVEQVVLVGAPNCGKSTLFNRLTHAGVPVGNRAGVTVSGTSLRVHGRRIGQDCPDFILTDLPGVRSLSPSGEDEAVTCHALRKTPPGLIINVLGATTLTRCLGLTLELREAYPGIPMICVVNMCDELWRQGIELRAEYLSG
jgi:ferrous iron transport protein B